MNYSLISIEGNIGAGKTTLARKLSESLHARFLGERFSDNPFLPLFYEDPRRYGFALELSFLEERQKQFREHLAATGHSARPTISDFLFEKSLLFAKINLDGEEYRLFRKSYDKISPSLPQPDLLIFLRAPINRLRENILKRGRPFEMRLSSEYLVRIQEAYSRYLEQVSIPCLVLDLAAADPGGDPERLKWILEALEKKWDPGCHVLSPESGA